MRSLFALMLAPFLAHHDARTRQRIATKKINRSLEELPGEIRRRCEQARLAQDGEFDENGVFWIRATPLPMRGHRGGGSTPT